MIGMQHQQKKVVEKTTGERFQTLMTHPQLGEVLEDLEGITKDRDFEKAMQFHEEMVKKEDPEKAREDEDILHRKDLGVEDDSEDGDGLNPKSKTEL